MRNSASITSVRAHFAHWVRTAEAGDTVIVTRRGKPVVALVSVVELEQFNRLRAADPQKGLMSLAGGWEGSEELVELLTRRP